MALSPPWGAEGDAAIDAALKAMYDEFTNRKKDQALCAEDTEVLARALATRLQKSYDETASEAFRASPSQESWVQYGYAEVNNSAYDAEKDSFSKVVDVLNQTLLSKKEFEIFQQDFSGFDTDGDGFLSKDEVVTMLTKQLKRPPTEKETGDFFSRFDFNDDGLVSFEEYMVKLVGKYEVTGLTDEDAMQGFLSDLMKVPVNVMRAGLKDGEFKGKDEALAALSEEEVKEEYKKQCLGIWASMTDEPSQQGEILAEVMEKLDKVGGAEAEKIKAMLESNA